jgi:hypothetical protein
VKIRLLMAAAVAGFAVAGPLAVSSSASTCSPDFQDFCYTTCNLNGVTYKVCGWFR